MWTTILYCSAGSGLEGAFLAKKLECSLSATKVLFPSTWIGPPIDITTVLPPMRNSRQRHEKWGICLLTYTYLIYCSQQEFHCVLRPILCNVSLVLIIQVDNYHLLNHLIFLLISLSKLPNCQIVITGQMKNHSRHQIFYWYTFQCSNPFISDIRSRPLRRLRR